MEGCYLNVVVGRRQGKGGEETEEAEADQDQPRGHDGGHAPVALLRCHTLVTRAVNRKLQSGQRHYAQQAFKYGR